MDSAKPEPLVNQKSRCNRPQPEAVASARPAQRDERPIVGVGVGIELIKACSVSYAAWLVQAQAKKYSRNKLPLVRKYDRAGFSTTSDMYALCKLRGKKLPIYRIRRYPNPKLRLLKGILGALGRTYIAAEFKFPVGYLT